MYQGDKAAGSHDHSQVGEACYKSGRRNVVSAMDQKRDFPLKKRQDQMNIIDIFPTKSKILRFEFTNCEVFQTGIEYM